MLYYLDSSVALHAVLGGPLSGPLATWLTARQLVSSRLLRTELIRALRCEGRPVTDADWLLARTGLLEIIRATHERAEAIVPHIRSLDALHLGAALGIELPLVVVTHDSTMKSVASTLGLTVSDPVDDPKIIAQVAAEKQV